MKKLTATVIAVLLLLLMLAGCAPKLPTTEEAQVIAKEKLDAVLGFFEANKYVIESYEDGTPALYQAEDEIYYLVSNFSTIFNSEALANEQIIKYKKDLGLLITKDNGVFVKKDSYDLSIKSEFTGEYTLTVVSAAKGLINCKVACNYKNAEGTVTTKDYEMILTRFNREVTGDDGKKTTEYYWTISTMFNPQ